MYFPSKSIQAFNTTGIKRLKVTPVNQRIHTYLLQLRNYIIGCHTPSSSSGKTSFQFIGSKKTYMCLCHRPVYSGQSLVYGLLSNGMTGNEYKHQYHEKQPLSHRFITFIQ